MLDYIRGKVIWLGWPVFALGLIGLYFEMTPAQPPAAESLTRYSGMFVELREKEVGFGSLKVKVPRVMLEVAGGEVVELIAKKGSVKLQALSKLVGRPAVAGVGSDKKIWTLDIDGQTVISYDAVLAKENAPPNFWLPFVVMAIGLSIVGLGSMIPKKVS